MLGCDSTLFVCSLHAKMWKWNSRTSFSGTCKIRISMFNHSMTFCLQEMCKVIRNPCRIVELEHRSGWPDFMRCEDTEKFPSGCKVCNYYVYSFAITNETFFSCRMRWENWNSTSLQSASLLWWKRTIVWLMLKELTDADCLALPHCLQRRNMNKSNDSHRLWLPCASPPICLLW
jgi:hypothetical protein